MECANAENQSKRCNSESTSIDNFKKLDAFHSGDPMYSFTSVINEKHTEKMISSELIICSEDEDSDPKPPTYKDRRREAHTQAEQKRRDAIKQGYTSLQHTVPTCQQIDAINTHKLSKATILQRSVDYIQQRKKQQEELISLRKELLALQIIKTNYEQIVKDHKNIPAEDENQLANEIKVQVIHMILDLLYQSFNAYVSVASFTELSASVFTWLEEHCTPQNMHNLMLTVLQQLMPQISS